MATFELISLFFVIALIVWGAASLRNTFNHHKFFEYGDLTDNAYDFDNNKE
jgi:hypothetical protein